MLGRLWCTVYPYTWHNYKQIHQWISAIYHPVATLPLFLINNEHCRLPKASFEDALMYNICAVEKYETKTLVDFRNALEYTQTNWTEWV